MRIVDNGERSVDSAEKEYEHIPYLVTAAGPTTVLTPGAGKRIRLRWVYAVNSPEAAVQRRIQVSIGAKVHSLTYGISKRQKFTGEVDQPLIVTLDGVGIVAFTAIYEEI